ncbi:hypothetical protein G6F57_016628 [Rhizopus arrhizus]|nr:hypothetical protein G6F57_016628 [Rhizopus arrhizus]
MYRLVRLLGRNESGSDVVSSTVRSSIFRADTSVGIREAVTPTWLGSNCGALLSSTLPTFHTTASALKSDPSWNFTPGRSLKRYRVGDSCSPTGARRGPPGPPLPSVCVRCRGGGAAFELVEEIDRAAQVRDHDRAADHQADREGLEELFAGHPGVLALGHVVADAVVAAQHHRGHQAQQFLGLHVQRAGLVGLRIQREEAAHHLVRFAQDALVHALAEFGELGDAVLAAVVGRAHAWPCPASSGSSLPSRCRAIMSS